MATPERFVAAAQMMHHQAFGGALVIKVRLGNDIRRLAIHNDDLTYDDLNMMMIRIFKDKLTIEDTLLIKYEDEDGDLVTIIDTNDLAHAKGYGRTLKLTLFVNLPPGSNGVPGPSDVTTELQALATSITKLLAKMEEYGNVPVETEKKAVEPKKEEIKAPPSVLGAGFDPLAATPPKAAQPSAPDSTKVSQANRTSSSQSAQSTTSQQPQVSQQQQQAQQQANMQLSSQSTSKPQQQYYSGTADSTPSNYGSSPSTYNQQPQQSMQQPQSQQVGQYQSTQSYAGGDSSQQYAPAPQQQYSQTAQAYPTSSTYNGNTNSYGEQQLSNFSASATAASAGTAGGPANPNYGYQSGSYGYQQQQ